MGLGDVWYKTKVYFGLAEDDDLYEDDEDGTLAEEDLEQRYRRRPNVRPLDARRGRGEVQVDDIFSEDTAATGSGSSRRLRDAGAQTSVLRARPVALEERAQLAHHRHAVSRTPIRTGRLKAAPTKIPRRRRSGKRSAVPGDGAAARG